MLDTVACGSSELPSLSPDGSSRALVEGAAADPNRIASVGTQYGS